MLANKIGPNAIDRAVSRMQKFQKTYEELRNSVFTYQTRTQETVDNMGDTVNKHEQENKKATPPPRKPVHIDSSDLEFAAIEARIAQQKSELAYASRQRQRRMVKEVDKLEAEYIQKKAVYEFHKQLLEVAGGKSLAKLHKLTWDMSLTGFPFGIFVCNELGETPLIIATKSGDEEVVCELLTYVCQEDLDHTDKSGLTALGHARAMRSANLVKHLGGTWTREDERERMEWIIKKGLEDIQNKQEELEENYNDDLEGIKMRGGEVPNMRTPDTDELEEHQLEQDPDECSLNSEQAILNVDKPMADGRTMFDMFHYQMLFERIYAVKKRKEFKKKRSVLSIRQLTQYFRDTRGDDWGEYPTDEEVSDEDGIGLPVGEMALESAEVQNTLAELAEDNPDLIVDPNEYRPVGYINGGYDSRTGKWYGEEVIWFYKDPRNHFEDVEITEREFLWKIALNEVSLDTQVWSAFCGSEWTKLSEQIRLIPPEYADWDKKTKNPVPPTTDLLFVA